jgi:hypothetical protein
MRGCEDEMMRRCEDEMMRRCVFSNNATVKIIKPNIEDCYMNLSHHVAH